MNQLVIQEKSVINLKSDMNRNLYLKLWGAAMMQITQEDIDKYIRAQSLKSYRCPVTQVLFKQNRYGLFRFKASELPMNKYLEIADNEERYLKGV